MCRLHIALLSVVIVILFAECHGLIRVDCPMACTGDQPCTLNRGDRVLTRVLFQGGSYSFPSDSDQGTDNSGLAGGVFCPAVDAFSVMTINASASQFVSGALLSLQLLGNYIKTPRLFRKDNLVVSFLTVVINLDKGNVTDMRWDDDCSACSNSACVDGNCAVDFTTECPVNPSACDPKVYIAWSGTDRQGRFMTSSGNVPSQFRFYSIGAVWNALAAASP
mmetsp:Transcript_9032/g.14794  ORF Transcript_9032/g.14794 Transcript_9032/m.14794 type:complete len:221 (+) Transcript_9032:321-983(+)